MEQFNKERMILNMKKLTLILGMIACILCLSACGSQTETVNSSEQKLTQEEALAYGDQLVEDINAIVQGNMEAQFAQDEVITAAFDSWKAAQADMGSYQNIISHEADISEDSTVITVNVSGTLRNAEVEILLDKDLMLSSVTTNVQYSFGELMVKALMNTAIGMGTVFVVLILISIIISAFVFIPRIQASFSKKGNQPEEVKKEAAVSSAPAPAVVEEEDLSDDLELVAVIAAAIAASEGASSTDGFVVRSIRRAGTNKWQRA